ncbi:hypothetical protein L3X37_08885 [Sabulilitoribacter arenilitoris]|uniref:Peptidase M56 domain-containing protein n=1 Tax=Wocania arenilitoris TaxID=2044858 RepID=A0AAE3JKU0_9FLAO|nr:M56 family metallopeptidase [Wocania arenilitoris]MCF7568478.1 hypothetical protein [Wocania arenilitoris]
MEYLLKASAVITIFYVCYKLFLKRDTFFESNRWFLLLGLITAFTLPYVVIPIYIEYTPMPIHNFAISESAPIQITQEEPFNIFNYLFTAYSIGVVIFAIRFCVQLLSLGLLIIKSKREKQNGFTYVKTDNNALPFSFFRWIVYNPSLFNGNDLQHIIAHEKVHVNQYHSIDIILSQLAAIVFWFNPITWFYKKDLQQNLEFIADNKAQNSTSCKKSYQHLLLKTSLSSQYMALTNNFYSSLTKKRIVMLHKSKSKKRNLFKYALVLPLLAIFLMSFNTEEVYVAKVLEDANSVETENKTEQHEMTSNDDKIKIIFRKDLSVNDLQKIKKKLQKMNITFTYKELNRNVKGEITKIIAKFETKGGHCIYSSDKSPIEPFYYFRHGKTSGVGRLEDLKEVDKEFDFSGSKTLDYNFNSNLNNKKTTESTHTYILAPDSTKTVYRYSVGQTTPHDTIKIKSKYIVSKNGKITDTIYSNNKQGFAYTISDSIFYTVDRKTISTDSIYFDRNTITTDSISWKTGHPIPNTKTLGNSLLINGEKPLYILDDIEISEEEIHNINPSKIASVTVLKDKTTTALYGKKAKDGVVIITTKKDWDTEFKVGKPFNSNKAYSIEMNNSNQRTEGYLDEKTGSFSLRGHAMLDVKESNIGLIFIDGKKSSLKKAEKIPAENIESISVLKGEKAIKKYGKKAKKGVIEITTKKKN